ncbi:MAG: glycosyltransferase [Clostridia bacterium]|nr:glycosyltransferase [Clostridia bacterium]
MKFKISVLMSVYHHDDPDYLKQALHSVFEDQSLKPDEIVVVFYGPLTKGLYDVLNEFRSGKESFVIYHALEKNVGLGEALRIGTGYCTGDYIFRMDADDISAPHRFERQMSFIADHPECDVVGTDIAEFEHSVNEKDIRRRICPTDHQSILKMAKHRNPMNHVSVCIKRKSLIECGGYCSLPLLEDYYLWLRMLAQNCVFSNLHESLVYVRIGNGFLNKRSQHERVKGWKTLQRFMLEHKMISRFTAWTNMVYIFLFTRMPLSLKNWVYRGFLRN